MSQLSLTTRGSVIQMSTQAREMAIKAIMIRHSAVRVKQPKFFVILLQFVLKDGKEDGQGWFLNDLYNLDFIRIVMTLRPCPISQ